jgi:acetyl-CoA carboxylase beta subunit
MIRLFSSICVFMVIAAVANPVIGGITATIAFFMLGD